MREFLRKIDVSDILREHFATLEDTRRPKRIKPGDVILFYVVPGVVTAVTLVYRVTLSDATIAVITTAMSILAGLLINLLVLMHSLNWDKHDEPMRSDVYGVLQQLHANISYAIVISLVAIIPLVVAGNYDQPALLDYRRAYGYVAVYLASHFAVTMLMIVKRMYRMLSYRLPDDVAAKRD